MHCVLCDEIEAKAYYLFNKQVTQERIFEVIDGLRAFDWEPDFTSASTLKKGKRWEEVPAHKIEERSAKEAYAEMPKEMLEYIRNMAEYDDDIFNKITGGAFKED